MARGFKELEIALEDVKYRIECADPENQGELEELNSELELLELEYEQVSRKTLN